MLLVPDFCQRLAEWGENLVPADADDAIVHGPEGADAQLVLEHVLLVDALEARQLAEVDADDIPAFFLERLDEVVASGQAAVLRIGAAARIVMTVHLPAQDDAEE